MITMESAHSRVVVPAERPMIANPHVISRRAAIGGGLLGLGGLMLFPAQLMAKGSAVEDAFVVLLKGRYGPVVDGPNLGLSSVDVNDGSYSTVGIYPVSGTPGHTHANQTIGRFFVQFDGELCAYH